MPARLELDRDHLAAFCRRHHVRRLALFGSVLRDDFGPDSDVDVLVEFEPNHVPGFIALHFTAWKRNWASSWRVTRSIWSPPGRSTTASVIVSWRQPRSSLQRDDGVYLGHMDDLARKVMARTDGLTRATFDADENLRLYVVWKTATQEMAPLVEAFQRLRSLYP